MEIKITGLDELVKKLDKLAADTSAPAMARRMGGARCPVHGKDPKNVQVVGTEVRGEFCCERARQLALDAALKPLNGQ
jgi:hypothetical protein